jgi:hypothetical protein
VGEADAVALDEMSVVARRGERRVGDLDQTGGLSAPDFGALNSDAPGRSIGLG